MSEVVDDKYYQVVRRKSIAELLLLRARSRIYFDFVEKMQPKPWERIVDVGVSDVINGGANFLEREYPHKERITACGLSEASEFRAAFPECAYVRIVPNVPLPFADGSFEIATSNAVLEHVGSLEHQTQLVSELCRVAGKVFISVPNRYFPVEHHTALPFVHFDRNLFSLACSITGRSEWADERNLILMTTKRLKELAAPINKRSTVAYTGLRLGPFSSNIFLAFA